MLPALLIQDFFSYLRSFVVPYKFYNIFFPILEKGLWNFDRDCTESVDHFGSHGHFNDLNVLIHKYRISFHFSGFFQFL